MTEVVVKRVYAPRSDDDGVRVLVDRLWPRGRTRAQVAAHAWVPEAAPSAALRSWFGHRPERWEPFQERYRAELAESDGGVVRLLALSAGAPRLTLLFAGRDEVHTHARVVAAVLRERLRDATGLD